MNQIAFSREQTNHLKGLFALCVVLHHLCSLTGVGAPVGLGPIYTALGYWSVSVFFFISGFGLLFQYQRFRGGYLANFLRNRVLPIYTLNAFLVLLYAVLILLLHGQVNHEKLLDSLLFGDTIVPFGWYLQVCIIFYLFFYLSFKWIRNIIIGIAIMSVLLAGYSTICYVLGLPTVWYECSITMGIGMIVQHVHKHITDKSNRHLMFLNVTSIILFIITFVLGTRSIIDSDLIIILKMLSSIFFALSVYFSCYFLRCKSRILDWLGSHYLEIYVFQGVGVLISKLCFNHLNPYIIFLFCLCCTLLLAAISKKPISILLNAIKK